MSLVYDKKMEPKSKKEQKQEADFFIFRAFKVGTGIKVQDS